VDSLSGHAAAFGREAGDRAALRGILEDALA
jgi:hypothetical protein